MREDDPAYALGLVRLANCQIDSKKINREKFFRREPVTIIVGDKKVIRFAVGAKSLPLKKYHVALDYDAIDSLNIKYGDQSDSVQIRRSTRREVWGWFYNHPDLGVRISIRIGVLGSVTGVTGILMSLASFM